MRIRLKTFAAVLVSIAVLAIGLVAPAQAGARADAPFGLCGDSFQLSRSGADVYVVGTGLNVYSSQNMLVYTAAYNTVNSPWPASPYGGARFNFSTYTSVKTTVHLSLTNVSNTMTFCTDSYFV